MDHMIFVDDAARLARALSLKIETAGEYACFMRPDGSIAGRAMVDGERIARHSVARILESEKGRQDQAETDLRNAHENF